MFLTDYRNSSRPQKTQGQHNRNHQKHYYNHPSRLGKVQAKQASLIDHRQQMIAVSQIRETTVHHGS
jgi:hypothetical protein